MLSWRPEAEVAIKTSLRNKNGAQVKFFFPRVTPNFSKVCLIKEKWQLTKIIQLSFRQKFNRFCLPIHI